MLELISIIAALTLCILTPFEVGKIRKGWVRKKFGDDRQKFIVAYQRQLNFFTWLGLGFGVLVLATAFLEAEPGEAAVKTIAAVIWFVLAVVCFVSRRRLPPTAPPGALSSSHA
jgi:hypothetical protein